MEVVRWKTMNRCMKMCRETIEEAWLRAFPEKAYDLYCRVYFTIQYRRKVETQFCTVLDQIWNRMFPRKHTCRENEPQSWRPRSVVLVNFRVTGQTPTCWWNKDITPVQAGMRWLLEMRNSGNRLSIFWEVWRLNIQWPSPQGFEVLRSICCEMKRKKLSLRVMISDL